MLGEELRILQAVANLTMAECCYIALRNNVTMRKLSCKKNIKSFEPVKSGVSKTWGARAVKHCIDGGWVIPVQMKSKIILRPRENSKNIDDDVRDILPFKKYVIYKLFRDAEFKAQNGLQFSSVAYITLNQMKKHPHYHKKRVYEMRKDGILETWDGEDAYTPALRFRFMLMVLFAATRGNVYAEPVNRWFHDRTPKRFAANPIYMQRNLAGDDDVRYAVQGLESLVPRTF